MLDFEYGVNTGNRFLQFVDHDEDPEAFIAAQTQPEPVQKKTSAKDAKQPAKKTTGKTTTTTSTTASTTKTNKENLTSKSTGADNRKQTTNSAAVFSDNNQQSRGDSARGNRGGAKRGAGGQFDGSTRGRSQRFNKFEGQTSSTSNEPTSFEQSGEGWSNEAGARGGRGRGGPRRGNFEGARGTGNRGRGRGGRGGNAGSRNFEEGAQESPDLENRGQSGRDYEPEVSPQERSFETDGVRRNNRGNFRARTYQTSREGDSNQEDHRAARRLHDRQPRNFVSTVKAIEKKDGEGAHNWGNPTENPEDHPISEEITDTTGQPNPTKDWAQQMDEADKQITLDEYKKQVEAKKRANQEKLPQFNTRTAGEGEDPKHWQKPVQVYRKKSNADGSDDDENENEEGSDEENESEEEYEEEQLVGKKKIITIPLRFKPIDTGRGSARGRRGAAPGRFRDRPGREENAPSSSPSQEQTATGPSHGDDTQGSYRGGQRGARSDQRRSYGNSNRNPRSGRSQADNDAPSLDNPDEFPTLPKQ